MKQQDSRQYRGYRNAGIRLREELVPSLALQKERTEPYLYAFHMFDKAHMVMLAEEDLIPKVAVRQLLGRLRDMEKDDITKARLEIGGGCTPANNISYAAWVKISAVFFTSGEVQAISGKSDFASSHATIC